MSWGWCGCADNPPGGIQGASAAALGVVRVGDANGQAVRKTRDIVVEKRESDEARGWVAKGEPCLYQMITVSSDWP